jgi:hypothetical protein
MTKIRGYRESAVSILVLLFIVFAGPAWPQVGMPEKDTFRLSHIRSFEPFAIVKGDKSEGLSVDILTEALAKVGLKAVFVGQDQDKEQE